MDKIREYAASYIYEEVYSEPCEISRMVCLAKIGYRQKSLTIFAKHCISDVWKGPEDASIIFLYSINIEDTDQVNPVFFSILCCIFLNQERTKEHGLFLFQIVFYFYKIGAFTINCTETSLVSITSDTSQSLLLYKSLHQLHLINLSKFSKYRKKKKDEDFFHF